MNPLNPYQYQFQYQPQPQQPQPQPQQPQHSQTQPSTPSTSSKKRLNVDSPSFTPSTLVPGVTASFTGAGAVGNGGAAGTAASNVLPASPSLKKSVAGGSSISPKAVSAAPFMPKSIASRPATSSGAGTGSSGVDWSVANVKDFVPQGFAAQPGM
ncbi:PAB-dependent poly(A)-specific ribonuclease subunit 3, partial [Ascosphaera atra]